MSGVWAAFWLAMHVTTQVMVLGFSSDGKAVLLEVRQGGPEGGGGLSFRIIGTAPSLDQTFAVSNDFSPGDGSTPQRVSADACRAQLAALQQQLDAQRFDGVTLQPGVCTKRDRTRVVLTRKRLAEAARPATDGKTYVSPSHTLSLLIDENGGVTVLPR